jgi:hypothetical protein
MTDEANDKAARPKISAGEMTVEDIFDPDTYVTA